MSVVQFHDKFVALCNAHAGCAPWASGTGLPHQNHSLTPDPRRASPSLRPGLSFRYTQDASPVTKIDLDQSNAGYRTGPQPSVTNGQRLRIFPASFRRGYSRDRRNLFNDVIRLAFSIGQSVRSKYLPKVIRNLIAL
jgi:hypothetical protein